MHTFVIATMFALTTSSAPARPSADDFFAGLARKPAAIEGLVAHVDMSEGLDLEIDYDLRRVGAISIAVQADPDGSGLGLVTVDGEVVAEVGFADETIEWQTVDFGGLAAEAVEAVAASVAQVWYEEALLDAFAAAEPPPAASCSSKCAKAGLIGTVAVGAIGGAGCYIVLKLKKPCATGAIWLGGMVGTWISGSCQGLACG